MARWLKVLAVALAAVVALVPAFAQVTAGQRVPESVTVLPVGEELVDDELWDIVGEFYRGFTTDLVLGGMAGIAMGHAASQAGASLELSITIGTFTFLGFLAGVWPRAPQPPTQSLLHLLLWDLFDPMWRFNADPRKYLI